MDEKRRKIRNKYTQLLLKSKKISDGYELSLIHISEPTRP